MTAPRKPRRQYVLALAFLVTFLAGASVGYLYLINKQMRVECNFNLIVPNPLSLKI